MSVTISTQSIDGTTVVTATSTLSPPVYYAWWLNGIFLGLSTSNTWTFRPDAGEQLFVEVVEGNSPDYDPATKPMLAAPARRLLQWIRSLDATCAAYQVQQNENSHGWTTIATINADPLTWQYSFTTQPLDDLARYQFRVLPLDAAGRAGTPIAIPAELIVRTPNAPTFSVNVAAGVVTIE
jgi:hypothetical protein